MSVLDGCFLPDLSKASSLSTSISLQQEDEYCKAPPLLQPSYFILITTPITTVSTHVHTWVIHIHVARKMNSNKAAHDTPLPPPPSLKSPTKQHDEKNTLSQSIPITNHIPRTESEIRLSEDMAFAEYRDHCMYTRVVTGIMVRQQAHHHAVAGRPRSRSFDSYHESRACVSNIRRTRYLDPEDCGPLYARHEREQTNGSVGLQIEGNENTVLNANDKNTWTQGGSFLAPTIPPFEEEDQVFILDL